MPQQLSPKENAAAHPTIARAPRPAVSAVPLALTDRDDEREVLSFLSERPAHTVVMSGYIRDNGLESPFNRGTFYACRDSAGALQGVALIGHAMFVEARTEEALEAFARLAQRHRSTHMLLGEQDVIRRFWAHYGAAGQTPRLFCRELLFEQRWPVEAHPAVEGLRLATLDDLMLVMPVHAALAYEESGVNPLEADLAGFRLRCARRIEQGRVWILVRDGQLIFKADVISDTPECAYLEGVYVRPAERGTGLGRRCILRLARELLSRTRALCLLVNERNLEAQSFYLKTGFRLRAHYDTIYLHKSNA